MSKCYLVVSYLEGCLKELLDHQQGDTIICADGGYERLKEIGLSPDLIIGDMDSLSCPLPEHIPFYPLPVEKDDTDTLAALKKAIELGFRDIILVGGLGGRRDHTLANTPLSVLLPLCRSPDGNPGWSEPGIYVRAFGNMYSKGRGQLFVPFFLYGSLPWSDHQRTVLSSCRRYPDPLLPPWRQQPFHRRGSHHFFYLRETSGDFIQGQDLTISFFMVVWKKNK